MDIWLYIGGLSRLSSWLIPSSSRRLGHHSSSQETGTAQWTSVSEDQLLRFASDEAVLQVPRTRRNVAYRRRHGLPVRLFNMSPYHQPGAYIACRILHWGAQKLRGCTFFSKSWRFFSRRPQNLEAHRTFLVERTVLLYWIKQALHPNKASFP